MDDYTTIKTINKFDVLIHKSIENPEDRFFVRNIHLYLAQSILYDFGEDVSKQLANVILASTEVQKSDLQLLQCHCFSVIVLNHQNHQL